MKSISNLRLTPHILFLSWHRPTHATGSPSCQAIRRSCQRCTVSTRQACPCLARRCSARDKSAFKFGLSLPDMRMEKAIVEAPQDGGTYCIRLANDAMPWVNGVNLLGAVNVTVAM